MKKGKNKPNSSLDKKELFIIILIIIFILIIILLYFQLRNIAEVVLLSPGAITEFVFPTLDDGIITKNSFVPINISITESNLGEISFNWNGNNYALYDDNLVLMYNFNDITALGEDNLSTADISQYNNFGNLIDDAEITTQGKYNKGLSLSGIGYLEVPDSPELNVVEDLSISLWVKTNSNGKMRLVSKTIDNGDSNNPYDFGIFDNNELYIVRADNSEFDIKYSTDTIPSQAWTHVALSSRARNPYSIVNNFPVNGTVGGNDYAAYQGITADENNLYIFSDRNENFGYGNTITKLKKDGTFNIEKLNAYNPEPSNTFSFGSGNIIDDKLYITAYNLNFKDPIDGLPLKSKVAIFDKNSLELIEEHDIVGEVVEGIDKKDNLIYFVEGNYGKYILYVYDENWNNVINYTLNLPNPLPPNLLTYQGLNWYGEDIYLNLHGSNSFGDTYAYGLDRYHFNGNSFEYVERLIPPTYGSGQGFDFYNDELYFVDRPNNTIISTIWKGNGEGDLFQDPERRYSIQFAINGISEFIGFGNILPTANSAPTLIGARGDFNSNFIGIIDDVKIRNRVLERGESLQEYFSSLYKYNSNKWTLFVNQSKDSQNQLDNGIYTYQSTSLDSFGNQIDTEIRTITIDSSYVDSNPSVIIISPLIDDLYINEEINLNYLVNDDLPISACVLYIDGVENQIESAVTKDTTQTFILYDLITGSYSWNIDCLDTNYNLGSSEIRSFEVINLKDTPNIEINNDTNITSTTSTNNQDSSTNSDLVNVAPSSNIPPTASEKQISINQQPTPRIEVNQGKQNLIYNSILSVIIILIFTIILLLIALFYLRYTRNKPKFTRNKSKYPRNKPKSIKPIQPNSLRSPLKS